MLILVFFMLILVGVFYETGVADPEWGLGQILYR